MTDRESIELNGLWFAAGVGTVFGIAGCLVVWGLFTLLRYYTHQVVASVLVLASLGFMGLAMAGIRISVKRVKDPAHMDTVERLRALEDEE